MSLNSAMFFADRVAPSSVVRLGNCTYREHFVSDTNDWLTLIHHAIAVVRRYCEEYPGVDITGKAAR